MITKCDHLGCEKAGVCRAPKSRDLNEYWHFCKDHAAEYNKNWNYYQNMTPDEIEADWEKQTFGSASKDKKTAAADSAEYIKFMNDFLNGRDMFDKIPSKKQMPGAVVSALKIFDLPITAAWRDVGPKYRKLAKKYHPDIAKNKKTASAEFAKINKAYETLKKHFNKM
jgi:hypothetical protein